MIKTTLAITMAVSSITTLAGPMTQMESKSEAPYFGLGASASIDKSEFRAKTIKAGYQIHDFVAIEGSLSQNKDREGPENSGYSLSVLSFPLESMETTYFKFEMGKSRGEGYLGASIGRHVFLSKNLAITPEIQYIRSKEGDDFIAGLSLNYFVGNKVYVDPRSIIDTDKDGVTDDIDECQKTPLGQKVDEEGCTIFELAVEKIDLSIQFNFNSSIIKEQSLPTIQAFAHILKKYPDINVQIQGHSSLEGDSAYNMRLSEKRAKSVESKLIEEGVSQERLSSVGLGETRPIALAFNESANRINRRVEAHFTVKEKVAIIKK